MRALSLGLVALFAACASRSPYAGGARSDGAATDGAQDVRDSGAADATDASDAPAGDATADAMDARSDAMDVGASCPPPATPGLPDGGIRCGAGPTCDPPRPDGGVCYGTPGYVSATTSVAIWVEDPSAASAGHRITLAGTAPITVGGHSYQNLQDGLVGGGANGVYGDLFIARDGQTKWTQFHFEGPAGYQGAGVWDFGATITVTRAGAATPSTIGRRYTITRTGPACPASSGALYTFAAEEPPRACAFGVDMLGLVLPGN